eukprot:GHVN01040052.1.p1 GENE.GHVN01040052.1~~GHVN01040052.1.p1  ORF type:complete len:135 (+),score=42.44 GHVN01040052.1:1039-1443(+)
MDDDDGVDAVGLDLDDPQPKRSHVSDLELPLATVTHHCKASLAASQRDGTGTGNVRLSRDAAVALNRSVGLFMCYIADAAREAAQSNKRQTVSEAHVMNALRECEFTRFADALQQSDSQGSHPYADHSQRFDEV